MKKKRKQKFYLIEWEEIEYFEEYVTADSMRDAIDQAYENGSGNAHNIKACEVSQDEYEESL